MPPIDLAGSVAPIHFVGIGGIGMSGIAEVMLNLGYQVSGSDIKESANVIRLRQKGAIIHIGHDAANVDEAGALVVSSAVKRDNPELIAARAKRIPVVRRAEMLAELMRLKHAVAVAGTHGKTTTTSLVAALMDASGFDPTVINGGIIKAYASNAKMGASNWMVVEADESDGSFLKLGGAVGIITNIDPEHMEHYGTFDVLRDAFDQFVHNLPFYGFAVVCIDHPEVQSLAARIEDRRIITYGISPQADVRITNLTMSPQGAKFDLVFQNKEEGAITWAGFNLPMMGEHNVLNATGAIATVAELGGQEAEIRQGLAEFSGVARRFTIIGEVEGVTIVDDYGHHPVEINAVLKAARQRVGEGRVTAVMQPHRYSRLADLFEEFCTCFNDADSVLITPVFAAGEDPLEGVGQNELVTGITRHGHRDAIATTYESLTEDLKDRIKPGDLVVCLGAGDITVWANELADRLEAMR